MKQVYIALKDIKTNIDNIKLSSICDVYSTDSILLCKIRDYKFNIKHGLNKITALEIIKIIGEIDKETEVFSIGETKCFVNFEVVKKSKLKKVISFFICVLILFFGGAITIINFHNDVNMPNVYKNIYNFFGGKGTPPYLMGILYSFGVFIGFVSILNIFTKANRTPGILDLEIASHRKEVINFKQDFFERKER